MAAVDYGMESRRLDLSRSTTDPGVVRLVVSGEVDIGTVDELSGAIDEILAEAGVSRLLLDFDLLGFLDSSGIAVLIGGYNNARERGIDYGVANCHGTVRNVLEITGVYDVLAADGRE